MRIVLETVERRYRSDAPAPCWVCGRRFAVGAVACWAYSDDDKIDCGPVCPWCVEEGPDRILERLEDNARADRRVAEESEQLADEGVSEVPTLEELRVMERLAALD